MKPGDRAAKIAQKNADLVMVELEGTIKDYTHHTGPLTLDELDNFGTKIFESSQNLLKVAEIWRKVNTQLGVTT